MYKIIKSYIFISFINTFVEKNRNIFTDNKNLLDWVITKQQKHESIIKLSNIASDEKSFREAALQFEAELLKIGEKKAATLFQNVQEKNSIERLALLRKGSSKLASFYLAHLQNNIGHLDNDCFSLTLSIIANHRKLENDTDTYIKRMFQDGNLNKLWIGLFKFVMKVPYFKDYGIRTIALLFSNPAFNLKNTLEIDSFIDFVKGEKSYASTVKQIVQQIRNNNREDVSLYMQEKLLTD